jgi:hypothetical protein
MNPHGPDAHSTSSSPTDGHSEKYAPDLLRLQFGSQIYNIYFEPYAISDGKVLVSDVKECASDKLNTKPGRLRLFYKGQKLGDNNLPAKAYDLKHNSKVLCFISDIVEDAPEDDSSSSKKDLRKNTFDAGGFRGFATGGITFGEMPGGTRTFHFSTNDGSSGFNFTNPADIFANFAKSAGAGTASEKHQQTSSIPQPAATTRRRARDDSSAPGGGRVFGEIPGDTKTFHFSTNGGGGGFNFTNPADIFANFAKSAGAGTASEKHQHTSSIPQPAATSRRRARYDPSAPGGDEPMAPRTSAYVCLPQRSRSRFLDNETPYSPSTARRGPIRFNSDEDHAQAIEGRGGDKAPDAYEQNPNKLRVREFQFQPPKLSAENREEKIFGALEGASIRSRVEQQTARDQLPVPEQPARPRSAPVTDFHGIAAKAFQEDVFVWSSVTRDLTPTMASVDTQSDRNLVYIGFLQNDLRLEYKKYNDSEAAPLRTLGGSVWPLGWVMLKIFPFKINQKSGIKERHRPQHVVFDVYEMTTFGDMLLGNEYAEGNDICNFLIKGSRKTTAQTEALRRQREEEFRRFEVESGQQPQKGQNHISTNASMNSSRSTLV